MKEQFEKVAKLVASLGDAIEEFKDTFSDGEDDDGGMGFVLIPEKELSQPIGLGRSEDGELELHLPAWDNRSQMVFKPTSLRAFFEWNEEVYTDWESYLADLKELRDVIQKEIEEIETDLATPEEE